MKFAVAAALIATTNAATIDTTALVDCGDACEAGVCCSVAADTVDADTNPALTDKCVEGGVDGTDMTFNAGGDDYTAAVTCAAAEGAAATKVGFAAAALAAYYMM